MVDVLDRMKISKDIQTRGQTDKPGEHDGIIHWEIAVTLQVVILYFAGVVGIWYERECPS
jgi:hypothetical protein